MKKITIQDGYTSHIVVYVNWAGEDIISEAEYKARLEDETNTAAADDYLFSQWLCKNYTTDEIWNMNEKEKEEVNNQWLETCRESMEQELCYERRVLI